MTTLDFVLPAALEAHEPPEIAGTGRDDVRLLVGRGDGRARGTLRHHAFTELPDLLLAGDVLVVNTSATVPAAVGTTENGVTVHFCVARPDGSWLVELRRVSDKATDKATGKATEPDGGGRPGQPYRLPAGATVTLRERYSARRLWTATVDTGELAVPRYLTLFGTPVRYGYVERPWPITAYQTVFGRTPGSAEMPSASRPFTDALVTRLVTAGVRFAPVLLHTGLASPEAHERPYPERFTVPATSAEVVNTARAEGHRVIAVGTTAVRALESAVGPDGIVAAADGWTELIVTPDRGVRAVSGLLTGFHEPRASHLDMLAAITGPDLLDACYAEALRTGYRWHEFGDLNLLLP